MGRLDFLFFTLILGSAHCFGQQQPNGIRTTITVGNTRNLACLSSNGLPAIRQLNVLHAEYACEGSQELINVTKIVRAHCQCERECTINPNGSLFRNLCPNVSKFLRVIHLCALPSNCPSFTTVTAPITTGSSASTLPTNAAITMTSIQPNIKPSGTVVGSSTAESTTPPASNNIRPSMTTATRRSTVATSTTTSSTPVTNLNLLGLPLTTLIPIIVVIVVLLIVIIVMLVLYCKKKNASKSANPKSDRNRTVTPLAENVQQAVYESIPPNNNQEMVNNVLYMSRRSNQPRDNDADDGETFDRLYIVPSGSTIKQSSPRHDYSHIEIPNDTPSAINGEQKVYNEIYLPKEFVEHENKHTLQSSQQEEIKIEERIEKPHRNHSTLTNQTDSTTITENDGKDTYCVPFN